MKRSGIVLAGLLPAAVVGWGVLHAPRTAETSGPPATLIAPPVSPIPLAPPDDHDDDDRSYVFRMPSGEPTALSCEDAKMIVEQVRAGLAYAPDSIQPTALAASAADWLDPHGLLSLAKDAPTTRALGKVAGELLAELEGRRQRACVAALGPAATLEQWSAELRAEYDRGRRAFGDTPAGAALEPLPPTGLAREVAHEIGKRVGAFEAVHGEQGKLYGDEARRRFFPPLDRAGWAKVVLASAVRAYVPLVDPHGEWAPFDEESRIYEVDLAARPPSRLWSRAVPTAVGVRVTDGAAPPFADGDIVLSIGAVSTAGLPLEQVDQLGFAAGEQKSPLAAVVLRSGKIQTIWLGERSSDPGAAPARASSPLSSERVSYGDGDSLVVSIKDVRDDLGDELASLIGEERDRGGRKLVGVVLDLRGNGGGSTDGALGALSLFLPGVPLFSMKRRDGTIEIDRASMPRDRERWTGPVATFVDGTTASAAEMIAGALATYKRGPSIGTPTFGKGCAQEYVDDDAHAGVLRLTTLVYALADGTPVQRIGLTPQLRFPFPPLSTDGIGAEREAKLTHTAPPWRGPDLRDPGAAKPKEEATWPAHGGAVGPCREPDTCRALKLLGGHKRPPVAKH